MALRSALVAVVVAGSVLSSPTKPARRDNPVGLNFDWGSETIRGVNIGGWLVLEPYAMHLFNPSSMTLSADTSKPDG